MEDDKMVKNKIISKKVKIPKPDRKLELPLIISSFIFIF